MMLWCGSLGRARSDAAAAAAAAAACESWALALLVRADRTDRAEGCTFSAEVANQIQSFVRSQSAIS